MVGPICLITDFNVPNFRFFELNRTVYKSTTKRASGGIIVYIRESLINQDSVVFLCTDSDDIIWLRLDDIANLRENLFLCLCYNLPSGTSRQGLNEESIFDRISSYMVHLQSVSDKPCRFIICGDMNARVANMNDFVADDASRHHRDQSSFTLCHTPFPFKVRQTRGLLARTPVIFWRL